MILVDFQEQVWERKADSMRKKGRKRFAFSAAHPTSKGGEGNRVSGAASRPDPPFAVNWEDI